MRISDWSSDVCSSDLISALPQGAEGTGGTDGGQVVDAVGGCDLRQFVRHARAAGDAGHHPLGAFQNAMEDALGAAHFPQHVDIDRTLAAGNVIGASHMLEIGRASCRERGWKYVLSSGGAVV